MNKQKIATGALAVAIMLVLSGCGPDLGKTIIEKTIESQTGGKVNIDSNKGEVTINSEQGNLSVSGDGTASLNKDFPKDVYIAPDAKIMMSLANGKDGSYSVVYTTAMKADEVYAKYKEELMAKSWTTDVKTEIIYEDSKMVQYKNGAKNLTLIIGLSQDSQFEGRTHVQVIGAEIQSAN
ncbi:MAG: hypothetical protein WCO05_04480 [Candidatus Moraniibacteriota bacterium]|jgi:hypothetical protein